MVEAQAGLVEPEMWRILCVFRVCWQDLLMSYICGSWKKTVTEHGFFCCYFLINSAWKMKGSWENFILKYKVYLYVYECVNMASLESISFQDTMLFWFSFCLPDPLLSVYVVLWRCYLLHSFVLGGHLPWYLFFEKRNNRNLASTCALPKCPQQRALGQTRARSQELYPDLPCGWQEPKHLKCRVAGIQIRGSAVGCDVPSSSLASCAAVPACLSCSSVFNCDLCM